MTDLHPAALQWWTTHHPSQPAPPDTWNEYLTWLTTWDTNPDRYYTHRYG